MEHCRCRWYVAATSLIVVVVRTITHTAVAGVRRRVEEQAAHRSHQLKASSAAAVGAEGNQSRT